MSKIRIVAGLILLWASSVYGARDIEFNVDFFCGWDGYYRPMEWTSVEIGITPDLKEPFAGSFTMTAQQDGLNTLNVTHSFVLTPDRPLYAPLVTKFAFGADKCALSIRDQRGRTRWRQTINLWDFSVQNRILRVVQEQDMLIGLIGQAQFGLLRLPQATACMSSRGQGKVYLGSKVPRSVPWDWTGFASLDLLVICDMDWTLLQPQQIKAICEWISNGGTALLILGQRPLPRSGPLGELLPFQVGEPRQVQIPSEALEEWGLDSSRSHAVTAWSLSPKPRAVIAKKIETPDAGWLYGTGYAGFGRVAVLAFSPSQLGEEQAGRSASFWTRHVTACCAPEAAGQTVAAGGRTRSQIPGSSYPTVSAVGAGRSIILNEQAPQESGNPRRGFNPNDNHYRISIAQNASNQVMEFLYQLKQMQPLSIWWVILILMALAVLLGPVDYFVLKRLDKLPYTWLTSTGWIVVFTIGAYFGVQWLRGGVMELRAVSVVDGIADSNCAWATSYTSLFAPRSDDYQFGGLAPNQWWSGIAPTREELWAYQRDPSMQQIHCLQVDGGNLPVSLRVNMWTVQPLLCECVLPQMPFAATVTRLPSPENTKEGVVAITINNTSDSPIQKGFILFEDTCADIGPVPAHSTKRFEVRTRPFRCWQPGGTASNPDYPGQMMGIRPGIDIPRYPGALSGSTDQAFFAQGCLNRTLVMHNYLSFGAAMVCVVYEKAPVSVSIKDHTYEVNHIQLARQLVLVDSR